MARKAKCMGLGVFEERHISRENKLLRNVYLELLKLHTPKLENDTEELIMTTTKRGRKAREITVEMLEDLKLLPIDLYCEKHNCSETFFLNLYYKNVSSNVVTEVVTEIIEKKVEIDIFDGLLTDTQVLYSSGYDAWMKHIRDKYENYEAIMQDILHEIQLKDHSQAEKIVLFDMLKEARINRSIYDDSLFFAEENKIGIIGVLEFKKIVAHRARWVKTKRGYKTRVMKKEFGEIIRKTEENN